MENIAVALTDQALMRLRRESAVYSLHDPLITGYSVEEAANTQAVRKKGFP